VPPVAPVFVVAGTVPIAGTGTDPDASDAMRYPVEVAARYSNAMSFRIGGQLIERRVRLGDRVRKGQVLARLEPSDAEKQASSAHASLEAAEHRLLYAQQQLERDRAQSAQNLIAINQLEQTEDAYATALAARDEAAAQRVIASNNLSYQSLVAEHDGLITSENADTGQVVAAGQAVYGLAWSGDTDVILDAAASDLGRIALGQTATVAFPGSASPELTARFEARVREIAPAADAQSRTYRVKLTLLKPGALHIGMIGEATLGPYSTGHGPAGQGSAASDPSSATLFDIPATALFHDGAAPAVWVIRADSTLELRRVRVQSHAERTSSVVGLKAGETIVLAGVHTVYAGERVQAAPPLFAAEPNAPR
jgi:RND family efflux transporter MFP subunit